MNDKPKLGELLPKECYDRIKKEHFLLIDVRTRGEWMQTGVIKVPSDRSELYCVEWKIAPNMDLNERFESSVVSVIEKSSLKNIVFICKSGFRSKEAILFLSSSLNSDFTLYNLKNGMEGSNGWIDSGLETVDYL